MIVPTTVRTSHGRKSLDPDPAFLPNRGSGLRCGSGYPYLKVVGSFYRTFASADQHPLKLVAGALACGTPAFAREPTSDRERNITEYYGCLRSCVAAWHRCAHCLLRCILRKNPFAPFTPFLSVFIGDLQKRLCRCNLKPSAAKPPCVDSQPLYSTQMCI